MLDNRQYKGSEPLALLLLLVFLRNCLFSGAGVYGTADWGIRPQVVGLCIDVCCSIDRRSADSIRGIKDGQEKTYYVWNNCSHQAAYQETGAQGVSYTTGVPATIGAMMFFKGLWRRPGVYNVEEFDPDPFMEQLMKQGLPWHEQFDLDLEL